jgi:hypothetical protein
MIRGRKYYDINLGINCDYIPIYCALILLDCINAKGASALGGRALVMNLP